MSSKKAGLGKTVAKSALVLGASLTALGAMNAPAFAQDEEEAEEAIVVTGTRIRQRDFQTTSPIATVGAEEISLTGTINVEELINSLPQVVPGVTITSNNPSLNGFATADLRGFGAGRTLILVNGRRANPSDRTGAVDLNTIPAALIERIELITGGASAVYGADAVAGAINFILRDDFEGMETNISYGQTEDGLAPEYSFDVAMGTPFADGRGNITLFAGYYSRDAVGADARPWSANARAVYLDPAGNTVVVPPGFVPPAGWTLFNPGGSATAPWASVTTPGGFTVADIAAASGLTLDADCFAGNGTQSTGGTIRFNAAGGIEPFQNCPIPSTSGQSSPSSNGDRYDFSPDNFLVLENERVNIAAFAQYEINDSVEAFIEMSMTNSRSQQQLAATPVTGLTVNVDLDRNVGTTVVNPYVTANAQLLALLNLEYGGDLDQRTLTMNIRPNQGGLRVGTAETTAYGVTGGLRGTFEQSELDWEVFGSYARNTTSIFADNNVGRTAINQLINACGVTTLAVQAAPVSALPNCPFPNRLGATFAASGNANNPLGLDSLSPAMLSFINVDTTDTIIYERSILGGFVAGDLWDLWGAGPIGFAAGVEYRQEALDSRADPFKAAGDIFGFNAQESIQGRYDVFEMYGEVTVPIISNQPFVHYLGFEGGYRFSDYSTGAGRTDTYKAGLEYSPVEWLTFRGIYNRAVRAPTAFELFQGGDQNFPGYGDPCNFAAINALPLADRAGRVTVCQNWFNAGGAVFPAYPLPGPNPAPTYAQSNSQVEAFQTGTPSLQPEISDSYTAGMVFNPDWWPVGRLGLSVDWFHLDLQNSIALRSIANILNGCVTQNGLGVDCALAPRDASGQIDFVNQTRSNNVGGRTEIIGIDYNIRWAYDLEDIGLPGTFGVATLVTWLDEAQSSTGAAPRANSVGFHDGTIGGGTPEWRSATTFTYDLDNLSLLMRWSWTEAMEQASFGTEIVEDYSLWTLGGRYDLNDNVSISASIDNLFDQEPQMFTDAQIFGQFQHDGSTQDPLGRSFRIGLTLRN
jgi:iron complex outermembrane receptor protein